MYSWTLEDTRENLGYRERDRERERERKCALRRGCVKYSEEKRERECENEISEAILEKVSSYSFKYLMILVMQVFIYIYICIFIYRYENDRGQAVKSPLSHNLPYIFQHSSVVVVRRSEHSLCRYRVAKMHRIPQIAILFWQESQSV